MQIIKMHLRHVLGTQRENYLVREINKILNACFTFGCALLSLFMRNALDE